MTTGYMTVKFSREKVIVSQVESTVRSFQWALSLSLADNRSQLNIKVEIPQYCTYVQQLSKLLS